MGLNFEQTNAKNQIISWLESYKKPTKVHWKEAITKPISVNEDKLNLVKTVAGSAGTGKTVLASEVITELIGKRKRVAVVAYTGKAASVLQKRLSSIIKQIDFVGTIHGLIYEPLYDIDIRTKKKVITGWQKKHIIPNIDIIIVDEASMISSSLWKDLLSYDIPIVAFGDNQQLPPIENEQNNLVINVYNKILHNPDFELKEVHRQAKENPIIQLAELVREKGVIPYGFFGDKNKKCNVFKLDWRDLKCKDLFNKIELDRETIILCAFNKTRKIINESIRKRLGYNETYPYPGERVICLKNNHNQRLMNGQLGYLTWVFPKNDSLYNVTIDMDDRDEPYSTFVSKDAFGKEQYSDVFRISETKDHRALAGWKDVDYFDFGYTISVHKSQGSEWEKVIVIEQKAKGWDDDYWRRWLYTAITRAKEKLFVIGNYYDY